MVSSLSLPQSICNKTVDFFKQIMFQCKVPWSGTNDMRDQSFSRMLPLILPHLKTQETSIAVTGDCR